MIIIFRLFFAHRLQSVMWKNHFGPFMVDAQQWPIIFIRATLIELDLKNTSISSPPAMVDRLRNILANFLGHVMLLLLMALGLLASAETAMVFL